MLAPVIRRKFTSQEKSKATDTSLQKKMSLALLKNPGHTNESMIADVPPKPFASTNVFMEREIEGEVTLYTYYIEVRNDVSKPFKYEYYLKDQSGSMQKITKSDFDKTTRQIFQDYTALSSRIGQKDFGYRQLDRMVRDYNYWMENQHDRSEYRVAMKTN